MTAIKEVVQAFDLLYQSIHDRRFRKTLPLHHWKERDLLPFVRSFLLGYFGHIVPEYGVKLPGSASGWGRVDFLVDNIAVEFAVRRPFDHKGPLSDKVNSNEVKKLMMHDGPSVLVLFDFSKNPFEDADLDRFRDWPSLGRGRRRRHAFNVSYHFIENARLKQYGRAYRNIRVRSSI